MKKTRMYVALCTLFVMLFTACGTKPTDATPTQAPLTTEAPAATATPIPTEAPEPTATTTPTEAPEPTATTAPTEAPAATATPEPTEAPAATATPAPTEAPAATATPAPTEAPVATATPVPTEAPVATATPVPTATPKPTSTPVPTKAPTENNDLTYDFNDLIYSAGHGQSYTVQNDGSVSIQYEQQYSEAKFTLPEAVDLSHCTGITVKAKSEYAHMAVKVFDAAFFENAYCAEKIVKYDCLGTGITDYALPFEESFEAVAIGIMASDAVDNYAPYNVTVYSITFHMDGSTAGKTESTTPPSVEGTTLLNTYGTVFGNMGTCVNLYQLQNKATLGLIKSHYNSVTSENEMKPDALLGYNPTLISVAEAKQLGYVIPANYKESTVPKINFTKVDQTLKLCAENGLKYRAHTLVWHSQTPNWFFRSDYSYSGAFVSKDVMDARMELYIRNVMGHVYDSEYGDIVYSWDVVNEYWNASSDNWLAIYGAKTTSPSFVKLAYQIADDVLRDYGIRDQVSLIFNDFNTYINTQKIIDTVKFINSDGKICDGFGMQAHLDNSYPSTDLFKNTVNAFLNTGLEVQITELDVTINYHGNKGHTAATQATYYYQLFKDLLTIKKNGGKITGLTCWGLGDDLSWRKQWTPLLFSTATKPKEAYEKAIQAYTDAGYTIK